MNPENNEGPLQINIPLSNGFSLEMSNVPSRSNTYPTSQLQKGWLLFQDGRELGEEAVGFGLPILKRGLNTLFPGSVDLARQREGNVNLITARYKLNLVEKLSNGGTELTGNKVLYGVKNFLAAVIRRLPLTRGVLISTSRQLRKSFNWQTTYAEAGFSEDVGVEYRIEDGSGSLSVRVDASHLSREVTEVVIMNEQGAPYFNQYGDSLGTSLEDGKIGCWDLVSADKAWFINKSAKIYFKLSQIKGTRLYRGRELDDRRLAWAGFGYSFPPSLKEIRYEVELGQTP